MCRSISLNHLRRAQNCKPDTRPTRYNRCRNEAHPIFGLGNRARVQTAFSVCRRPVASRDPPPSPRDTSHYSPSANRVTEIWSASERFCAAPDRIGDKPFRLSNDGTWWQASQAGSPAADRASKPPPAILTRDCLGTGVQDFIITGIRIFLRMRWTVNDGNKFWPCSTCITGQSGAERKPFVYALISRGRISVTAIQLRTLGCPSQRHPDLSGGHPTSGV
jgi:hypothetical protein